MYANIFTSTYFLLLLTFLDIQFFFLSLIQGSSFDLSGIMGSDYWIDGGDGICKTVSNTGEVQEQDCQSTDDHSSVTRKPLCQLGIIE